MADAKHSRNVKTAYDTNLLIEAEPAVTHRLALRVLQKDAQDLSLLLLNNELDDETYSTLLSQSFYLKISHRR